MRTKYDILKFDDDDYTYKHYDLKTALELGLVKIDKSEIKACSDENIRVYVGVNDRNNVPIYVGDMFKHPYPLAIFWFETYGKFELLEWDGEHWVYNNNWKYSTNLLRTLEKDGNIYENKNRLVYKYEIKERKK